MKNYAVKAGQMALRLLPVLIGMPLGMVIEAECTTLREQLNQRRMLLMPRYQVQQASFKALKQSENEILIQVRQARNKLDAKLDKFSYTIDWDLPAALTLQSEVNQAIEYFLTATGQHQAFMTKNDLPARKKELEDLGLELNRIASLTRLLDGYPADDLIDELPLKRRTSLLLEIGLLERELIRLKPIKRELYIKLENIGFLIGSRIAPLEPTDLDGEDARLALKTAYRTIKLTLCLLDAREDLHKFIMNEVAPLRTQLAMARQELDSLSGNLPHPLPNGELN